MACPKEDTMKNLYMHFYGSCLKYTSSLQPRWQKGNGTCMYIYNYRGWMWSKISVQSSSRRSKRQSDCWNSLHTKMTCASNSDKSLCLPSFQTLYSPPNVNDDYNFAFSPIVPIFSLSLYFLSTLSLWYCNKDIVNLYQFQSSLSLSPLIPKEQIEGSVPSKIAS